MNLLNQLRSLDITYTEGGLFNRNQWRTDAYFPAEWERRPDILMVSGPLCHLMRRTIKSHERYCQFEVTDEWAFRLGFCWWESRIYHRGDVECLSRFGGATMALPMVVLESEVRSGVTLTATVTFEIVRPPEIPLGTILSKL